MGTWGHGSFENDTAADWIWDLKPHKRSLLGKQKDPFTFPLTAIDKLLSSDQYLECTECDEAIAAAECIAAAINRPMSDPPEQITKWVLSLKGQKPDPQIINRTIEAVQKIRNDEQSESRSLWIEASDSDEPDQDWLSSIDDLMSRLQ